VTIDMAVFLIQRGKGARREIVPKGENSAHNGIGRKFRDRSQ